MRLGHGTGAPCWISGCTINPGAPTYRSLTDLSFVPLLLAAIAAPQSLTRGMQSSSIHSFSSPLQRMIAFLRCKCNPPSVTPFAVLFPSPTAQCDANNNASKQQRYLRLVSIPSPPVAVASAPSAPTTSTATLPSLLVPLLYIWPLPQRKLRRRQPVRQIHLRPDRIRQIAHHKHILNVIVEISFNIHRIHLRRQRQRVQ